MAITKILAITQQDWSKPLKTPEGVVLRGDRNCCAACGKIFNSTFAFDKHRTGPAAARRCMTTDEMKAKGMSQNAGGWWITSLREKT